MTQGLHAADAWAQSPSKCVRQATDLPEVDIAGAPAVALPGGAGIQMLPQKLGCSWLVGGHHHPPLGCHLGAVFQDDL